MQCDHTLPLAPDTGAKTLVTGRGSGTIQTLATTIAAHGVSTQRVYTGSAPNARVFLTTNNAWGDASQQSLAKTLLATGKPVVVVALGGPYDLAYLPAATTFLAAYGYQNVTLSALVASLFGSQPGGHLPVSVGSADGSSDVVARFGTGLHY
jgi:beta-N-acetylhexosaminidase